MKKKIKIAFSDFWEGFDNDPRGKEDSLSRSKNKNFFYTMLSDRFEIEISDNPDYLIYSCFGNNHYRYRDCKKIFYTGENLRPELSYCDYAITFDYINDSKCFRFPLIGVMIHEHEITKSFDKNIDFNKIKSEKTKFCNFVFSNPAPNSPRNYLFLELSKYKNVDSGGKVLNNLGYLVEPGWGNKIKFLKDYKFTICFENSQYPGYTTEKLIHPMMSNSIPIYWGNPEIHRDFNTKSFINGYNFTTVNEIVEFVKEVDNNDDMYYKMLSEPYFNDGTMPSTLDYNTLLDFFENKVFN